MNYQVKNKIWSHNKITHYSKIFDQTRSHVTNEIFDQIYKQIWSQTGRQIQAIKNQVSNQIYGEA